MFRGKFGYFRLPTNKPDTVRKQVDESGATKKTWKEKPRAEARGEGGTRGLVYGPVMKRIMIKVSQGLIISQINAASFPVQSNTRKTVSSSTKNNVNVFDSPVKRPWSSRLMSIEFVIS